MKIALHNRKNSFSELWKEYFEQKGIPYKIVDCYQSDIIDQLDDCDALMWHFHHAVPQDILFAQQLLFAIESAGKIVFPSSSTMWHFNDKIGQKYLLEAIGAPLVPSYVFYSRDEAFKWINECVFPKVFKLRVGASSQNVKLVKTKEEANRLVKRAFGSGFSQYTAMSRLKESIRKYKLKKATFLDVVKGVIRFIYKTDFDKLSGKEKGYVYFQDFIPDNSYDIRVIVIDNKAFAIKRLVRNNDFRASGSGMIYYEKDLFDETTLKISFELARKLKTQCIAFDFVYTQNHPLVVEISYGFSVDGYKDCPGYWDNELVWHEGYFNAYGWMVDEVARDIENRTVLK